MRRDELNCAARCDSNEWRKCAWRGTIVVVEVNGENASDEEDEEEEGWVGVGARSESESIGGVLPVERLTCSYPRLKDGVMPKPSGLEGKLSVAFAMA